MSLEVLYNTIGVGYNISRRADPYLLERLYAMLKPEHGKLYLDIGCGTGNYTKAFAAKGVRLWGVDPSENMLSDAASMPVNENSEPVKWIRGTAEEIPAGDNSFDGALATLTLHHWQDHEKAFAELARVLKPGSRLVIFSSTPEQMKAYWLVHYFPEMLRRSTAKMPSLTYIEETAKKAGFSISSTEKYFVQDDLQDLFLQSGKNKPELYFKKEIRNGISSFASLSNISEVDEGLRQLRSDMNTGKFKLIKEQFDSDLGDYIFIVMHLEK